MSLKRYKKDDWFEVSARRSFNSARKRKKTKCQSIKKRRRTFNEAPQNYRLYIKSDFWTRRRADYFKKFGKQCAICGARRRISLHHIVYGKLGSEKDEHLVALCWPHHEALHNEIGVKANMTKETNAFIVDTRQFLEFPKF